MWRNNMQNWYFLPSEITLLYPQASTDQSAIDTDIPYRLGRLEFALIQLLGIVTIMSQIAWKVFIFFTPVTAIFIVVIPVTAIFLWYQVSNFAPWKLMSNGCCFLLLILYPFNFHAIFTMYYCCTSLWFFKGIAFFDIWLHGIFNEVLLGSITTFHLIGRWIDWWELERLPSYTILLSLSQEHP